MKKKFSKTQKQFICDPTVTVESAVEILDHVWSKEDPIWVNKIEMTPASIIEMLSEQYHGEISSFDSKLLKIEFYRLRDDCIKRSKGTLFSMILDRMGAR